MAFRSGTWLKARSKYRAGAGYANINLSLYRVLSDGNEEEFKFNFKTIPIFASIVREVKGTAWSAGIQYWIATWRTNGS